MTNTTTPAESIGAQAGASFYRWEVADKPIAILFSLDLMDRMEREVLESFKAVTKRGSEIGGVLGGRVVAGSQPTVIVERFEAVECDYSRGPLYLLSDEDKVRMTEALHRVSASGSVAGFFRSNTRRELVLDEEDQSVAKEFFSDPNHVFLLVRPFAMKPSAGGFFFWENGQLTENSYQEFPFKRAELVKNFSQFIVAAPESAAAKEPLVMPKRDERPAAPPITMRREEPRPVVAPPVAPPRREEAAAPPPVFKREEPRQSPVAPPRREEAAAPPPVFKREEPRQSPVMPPRREQAAAPPPVFKREEPRQGPVMPPRREQAAAPPPVFKREEPRQSPVMPPRREEAAAPPPVFKREEPRPSPVAPPRHEEALAPAPPPVFKREEPRPSPVMPPEPEEAQAPVPPPVFKREERSAPPMMRKRDERPPIVPSLPKREERPSGPTLVSRREEPPAAPAPPPVQKREEVPPAPAVTVKREERPPVVVKREEKPAQVVVKREEPATAKVEEKPVATKQAEAVVVAPPKKDERVKVEPSKPEPKSQPATFAPVAEPAEESKPGAFARFKWVIAAVVVLAVLGAGYYMFFRPAASPAGTTQVADTSLGLKVENNSGQLQLSWNRTAPLVLSATRGTLTINDGDHKEDVDLDLATLHTGSVDYAPISNDVSFRLEVVDQKSGKSQAETVRRLTGRPSAAIAATTTPGQQEPAAAAKPENTKSTASVQPAPVPVAPPPPAPVVESSTAVTKEVPKQNTLAARLRAAPELPPSMDSPQVPLGGSAPGGALSVPPPPVPAQKTQPPPQTAKSAPAPVASSASGKVGGVAQPATILRRVAAVYPSIARSSHISGIVRVRATIGTNGKVKHATAISGPQILRSAAVDSVMKWLYNPAILDGEPVEIETQVDVSFQM
jgi:outer membrane biosynthesis protein TonB